jgi:hypothetical protein
MKVDLKKLPAYYINLEHHQEKNKKTLDLLNQLGFHSIFRLDGVLSPENPIAGCSKAHYQALAKIGNTFPFLLFEDDIVFMNQKNWNDGIIEIPSDADAVYLGTSTWGRMNGHNGEFVQYDKNELFPNIVRIYNMLATHAILYLNAEYINIIKRAAFHTGYVIKNYNDVAFAELQRFFNVYSVDSPFFAQTSNLEATNKSISSIRHTECMSINTLNFYPYTIK